MKTLIVYESKYGSTSQCVAFLKQALPGEVTTCNLALDKPISPDRFDSVIIGGPVYRGRLPQQLRAYCERQRLELTTKKLGLFVCGIMAGELADRELNLVFPEGLNHAALQKSFFGGAIYLSQMNLFERLSARFFKSKSSSGKWQKDERGQYIEHFDTLAIEQFAKSMYRQSDMWI